MEFRRPDGSRLCSLCEEKEITLRCNDCSDEYCLLCGDCYVELHKPRKMHTHTGTMIVTREVPLGTLERYDPLKDPDPACQRCKRTYEYFKQFPDEELLWCADCMALICTVCDCKVHISVHTMKHVRQYYEGLLEEARERGEQGDEESTCTTDQKQPDVKQTEQDGIISETDEVHEQETAPIGKTDEVHEPETALQTEDQDDLICKTDEVQEQTSAGQDDSTLGDNPTGQDDSTLGGNPTKPSVRSGPGS